MCGSVIPHFFFFAIEPAVSFFLFLERTCSQLKRKKKKRKRSVRKNYRAHFTPTRACHCFAFVRFFFFFLRLFCEVRKVFTSETPPVCLTPVAAFAASSFPPLLLPRYVCVCVFFLWPQGRYSKTKNVLFLLYPSFSPHFLTARWRSKKVEIREARTRSAHTHTHVHTLTRSSLVGKKKKKSSHRHARQDEHVKKETGDARQAGYDRGG